MTTEAESISASPAQIRQLARDNQEMGIKLAQHEFNAIMQELADPTVFDLQIDFPNPPAPTFPPAVLSDGPELRRLPRLNVQLGTVAWHIQPQDLPAIGIFIPKAESHDLRQALVALFTAHFSRPFARLVFLCESLRLAPLMGRYQFTYEYLGNLPPIDASIRLQYRFGVQEIRHLLTGNSLWRADSSRVPTEIQKAKL